MWIATLNKYLLAGALLVAVLVASGISAQLFATSDTLHGSSLEDADPTLYAHGHRLRPLVEETSGVQTLNIYAPGDQIIAQVVRDGLAGQKVRHLLADHLGSTGAAVDADRSAVAQFEYGPHGETAASGVASAEARYRYTGHPYDAAQGVYETPARGYDPTTGRFLSVDPQRQDASPYVYADANPINKLDPNGQWPLYFFLYSKASTTIISEHDDDPTTPSSMLNRTIGVVRAARQSRLPIVAMPLEGNTRTPLPAGGAMEHLTLTMHGDPGDITVRHSSLIGEMKLTGDHFATFLHRELVSKFGWDVVKELKSITLLTCFGSCPPPDGAGPGSVADAFARVAGHYFPNLQRVIASPYEVGHRVVNEGNPSTIRLSMFPVEHDEEYQLFRDLPAERFFAGDFPRNLFERPRARSFMGIIRPPGQIDASSGGLLESTARSDIRGFIRIHRDLVREPFLRSIQVPHPEITPVE